MKTSVYLIVKASRARYGQLHPETGLKRVESVRVVGMRQNRPARLERDEIAVKLTIDTPSEAFNPIMPIAEVVIPKELVRQPRIEIEASDANEGDTNG